MGGLADADTVAAGDGRLQAAGPQALAAAKTLLRRDLAATHDLAAMSALSARHFAGAEGQEGIAARRERRRASWHPPDG